MTVELLRWELFQLTEGGELVNGELPRPWNSGYSRAIKGLVERHQKLELVPRTLSTFGECVTHYPAKTLNGAIRDLRIELLPELLALSREESRFFPKYSSAANEDHFIMQLPKERQRALENEWNDFEVRLRPIYGSTGSDKIFRLICRGRSLFGRGDVSVGGAFSERLKDSLSSGLLPQDLLSELQAFHEGFMAADVKGHYEVASFVHTFANVSRHGGCTLREDAKHALRRRKRSVIEGMPNFKKSGKRDWLAIVEFDPLLSRLFDHSVFKKFSFIRLVTLAS